MLARRREFQTLESHILSGVLFGQDSPDGAATTATTAARAGLFTDLTPRARATSDGVSNLSVRESFAVTDEHPQRFAKRN